MSLGITLESSDLPTIGNLWRDHGICPAMRKLKPETGNLQSASRPATARNTITKEIEVQNAPLAGKSADGRG